MLLFPFLIWLSFCTQFQRFQLVWQGHPAKAKKIVLPALHPQIINKFWEIILKSIILQLHRQVRAWTQKHDIRAFTRRQGTDSSCSRVASLQTLNVSPAIWFYWNIPTTFQSILEPYLSTEARQLFSCSATLKIKHSHLFSSKAESIRAFSFWDVCLALKRVKSKTRFCILKYIHRTLF